MINKAALNKAVQFITDLFPDNIKVFSIPLKERSAGNITASLLHKNFCEPLSVELENKLFEEIALYLSKKEPGYTYTFFYRNQRHHGIREWNLCSAKLHSPANNSSSGEIVLFTYDLSLLEEQKNRTYKILDDDLFFKEHLDQMASLTRREKEIAILLSSGYSNNQIAKESNISEHTVTTHRKNINQKLGIQNLAGLLQFADVFEFSKKEPA